MRSFLSLSLSHIMKVCDAGAGGGGGVWCGAVMKIKHKYRVVEMCGGIYVVFALWRGWVGAG